MSERDLKRIEVLSEVRSQNLKRNGLGKGLEVRLIATS
jgi:hypothetical protein